MFSLMQNQTFRILKELKPTTQYLPGIYRVILNAGGSLAAVLIYPDKPETEEEKNEATARKQSRGGRPPNIESAHHRKNASPPLVGRIHWLETQELTRLQEAMLLSPLVIEREGAVLAMKLTPKNSAIFEARKLMMAAFLDQERIREELRLTGNLSRLFEEATQVHGVDRSTVAKQWSKLCRHGLEERSLYPRFDRCGAKGKPKRCDPPKVDEEGRLIPGRKKAGRKTTGQRIAAIYGEPSPPTQPGMSTEWSARVLAANAQIPSPKPKWGAWLSAILKSHFVGKAKEVDGGVEFTEPEPLTYPSPTQIRRVLNTGRTKIEQAMERTTARHFQRAMRGLVGRNWMDTPGPGYAWAIDSTVGDIHLRSSLNLAWIIGRPIVYVIVDIWSTAVLGFYVCLTGPSWETAAVSIFNSVCNPALEEELWNYKCLMKLDPLPGMCHTLLCDRGEYLSKAHRCVAKMLKYHSQFTPPYAGDLKGLVEVLHRIAKDAQYLFVPGAIDHRRKELELRQVDPASCTMTLKEYAAWLQLVFAEYNFTADRTDRLDAHMIAAGVEPTPAGLWTFGHAMGIGFGRPHTESDLVMNLLPEDVCRVGRSSVRFRKNDYMSQEVKDNQWTTLARLYGGSDLQAHYYPGSMSRIWTPNTAGEGLLSLHLSDQSRASPELTHDEFDDSLAFGLVGKAKTEHDRLMRKLLFHTRRKNLVSNSFLRTAEALAKASGPIPNATEARLMEVAAATSHGSEAKATEALREEQHTRALSEFEQMMRRVRNERDSGEAEDV